MSKEEETNCKPFPPATSISSLAANSIAFAANSGLCTQGCKLYHYITRIHIRQ